MQFMVDMYCTGLSLGEPMTRILEDRLFPTRVSLLQRSMSGPSVKETDERTGENDSRLMVQFCYFQNSRKRIQQRHLLSAPDRREELETTWGGATVSLSITLRTSSFSSWFMWTSGSYLPVSSLGSSMGRVARVGTGYTTWLGSHQ